MPQPNNVTVSIADFGPVEQAEIELRPLTVFIGPGNTGKSYTAKLVYALHKFFGSVETRCRFGAEHGVGVPELSDGDIAALVAAGNDLIDKSGSSAGTKPADRSLGDVAPSVLDERTASLLRPGIERALCDIGSLNGRLCRDFGVGDVQMLARNRDQRGARIKVSRGFAGGQRHECAFAVGRSPEGSSLKLADGMPLRMSAADLPLWKRRQIMFILHRLETGFEHRYNAKLLLGELTHAAASAIISPLNNEAHYLPAERSGVMLSHRIMPASLIQHASLPATNMSVPPISGIAADFLQQIISLGSVQQGSPPEGVAANVATLIEKDVLRGEVHIESSAVKYPDFFYAPLSWEHEALPISAASSSVTELAPVVLFLRHVLKPDNLLIIEEPEANLHPEEQIGLMRLLAAAVKLGVRVIITTQSEWMLDELARLAFISELPNSNRDGIAAQEHALDFDNVGIWEFSSSPASGGSNVSFSSVSLGLGSWFHDLEVVAHNEYVQVANRISALQEFPARG